MASLKTWCFLPITVLLLLSIVPTVSEVVRSVADCDQFFLVGTPPQFPRILEGGRILDQNRYKCICQTYRYTRRFVTLYDTMNRIAVFSAGKYRGEKDVGRPPNQWKIEPQLENDTDGVNMVKSNKITRYEHQAGDIDYRNNGRYDRGHLFPSSYASSMDDKIATFTLTNAVPQEHTFNTGSWNRMEMCVKSVMDKYCKNSNGVTEGFVVTGAQPSANNVLENRINIPSMLWSAFCCYSSTMGMWLAGAHWGDNVPDKPADKYLQTKTLAELNDKMSRAGSRFNVFPMQCPLHTTVAKLYPQIKNSNCPPSSSTTPTSGHLSTTSASLASTSGPLRSSSAPPAPTSLPPSTSSPSTTSCPAKDRVSPYRRRILIRRRRPKLTFPPKSQTSYRKE